MAKVGVTPIYRKLWPWLALGGFILVLKGIGAPGDAEVEQLRIQFNLPQTAVIDPVDVQRPSLKENIFEIEGIVRFDERQFHEYLQSIRRSDGSPLRPVLIEGKSYGGSVAATTARWREMSGSQLRAWGSLSDDAAQMVKRGMAFCYVLVSPSKATDPDQFAARSCDDDTIVSNPAIVVQGLLDGDTRMLHMLIRRVGFPLFD